MIFPLPAIACLAAAQFCLPGGAFAELAITTCGEQAFQAETAVGLSGLTWAGGDRFYAVSDRSGIVPVTLRIDPASGRILDGAVGAAWMPPTDLRDFEGIAWHAPSARLFVSAEQGPGIDSFTLDRRQAGRVALPGIFRKSRTNLSLESLTISPSGNRLWTANEEALLVDGPLADAKQGTLVRLQEFSAGCRPLRQFAWRTESAAMRLQGSGSGVADLCALPGGKLLVLERGFGLLSLRCRIFLADFSSATDTSPLPSLEANSVRVAGKTLLMDKATGKKNYEGIALGPALRGGGRSLILVADSGDGLRHVFLALRISGLPAE
ncbi:MAG: esterase-like activity of phytase family protein [Verrucomicrobiales bacterium]|nr:esterase-like activity of phytase family protein [Verrucomicrobiales bacterium]